MNLNCETILDLYTLKNRLVLCQIKVDPKSHELKNTCRSLSQEQWLTFDKELEQLLAEKDNWNDEKSVKFNMKPNLQVKIHKSKLSFKHFNKCLDIVGDFKKGDIEDAIETNWVLECLIDAQLEVPIISAVASQEYEPKIKTSQDGKLCSQLPYEPYTPSKKMLEGDNVNVINKNTGIDAIEYSEDTYSPKSIFEADAIETLTSKSIPKYTPAPINAKRNLKEMKKLYHLNPLNEVKIKLDGEISSIEKKKSLRTKLNKKSKRMKMEYIPKCEEVAKDEVPIYIPTPIEKTKKDLGTDNIRKNKTRSNTIDIFPECIEENTKEIQISEKGTLDSKELHSHCYEKMLKERSMSIDEIPTELEDVPVYVPTPIEEQTLQNVLKPCNQRNKKRSNAIDVFPELLNENIKEKHIPKIVEMGSKEIIEMGSKEIYSHCKRKKLRKLSNSTDEIAAAPAEIKDKIKPHKSLEKTYQLNETYDKTTKKKSEKDLTSRKSGCMSVFVKNPKIISKAQTTWNDNKLENGNHSTITEAVATKYIKRDIKMETSSTLTKKSLRRSERSPSKPNRFLEEERNNRNNCKKLKTSPKNKELFGSDDDDDDDCF